jgi:hypothetical protein
MLRRFLAVFRTAQSVGCISPMVAYSSFSIKSTDVETHSNCAFAIQSAVRRQSRRRDHRARARVRAHSWFIDGGLGSIPHSGPQRNIGSHRFVAYTNSVGGTPNESPSEYTDAAE